MPATIQTASYTLITGAIAASGAFFDVDKTLENTVYYLISGNSANSSATFVLEARDPQGNVGYIVDTLALTGSSVRGIATFNTPISNGIRANIQNVLNASGYVYLDASY
jgi:hypothetical protein